jgi:hypothetical protein
MHKTIIALALLFALAVAAPAQAEQSPLTVGLVFDRTVAIVFGVAAMAAAGAIYQWRYRP